MIDSGYFPDAVFEFVRKSGEPFRASKGIGGNFQHGQQSKTRRVGKHWFATAQAERQWLYCPSVDHWKRAVHQRFITEPIDADGRPNSGSLTLFIPAGSRDHHSFAQHILAEEWVTEFLPGKGERSYWLNHSANNHYLDATALCLCAGEMAGFGMFQRQVRQVQQMSLGEMREAANRSQ